MMTDRPAIAWLLVSLSCVAALPAASAQSPATSQQTAELQGAVEQLVKHFEFRKRFGSDDNRDFRRRYEALGQALDAWNQSQRSDLDANIMRGWLAEAARAAMVGSAAPMPRTPDFPERLIGPETSAPPVDAVAEDSGSSAESIAAPNPTTNVRGPGPNLNHVGAVTRQQDSPARPNRFDNDDTDAGFNALSNPEDFADAWIESPAPEPAPLSPEAPAELGWTDHPAAAQLDWGDPFADDQQQPGNGPLGTRQNRFKPVTQKMQVSEPRIKLDLLELSSRVAGHNSHLRELEGVLLGSRDLTAFRLAAVVRDLDELREQRSFLRLYLQALTPEEAALGPRLDSFDSAVRFLQDAVDDRSQALLDRSDNQSGAERAILSALERKLADLGTEQ